MKQLAVCFSEVAECVSNLTGFLGRQFRNKHDRNLKSSRLAQLAFLFDRPFNLCVLRQHITPITSFLIQV